MGRLHGIGDPGVQGRPQRTDAYLGATNGRHDLAILQVSAMPI
jgi:hypothetical protein